LESRVQNQIQQRAQQQIRQAMQTRAQGAAQARVQARVQERLQARFEGRPNEQVRQAMQAADRANNALRQVGSELSAGRDASNNRRNQAGAERTSGNASLATRQAIADQYPEGFSVETLTEADRAKLPKGFQKANEAALEAVFGRFANFVTADAQPSDQTRSVDAGEERAIEGLAAGPAVELEALVAAKGRRGLGNRREQDLENRIQVAARHRRAEIASMRDRALNAGDVSMMARADRSELNLEAFLESRRESRQARVAELPTPQSLDR